MKYHSGITLILLCILNIISIDGAKLGIEDIKNMLKTSKGICLKRTGANEELVDSVYRGIFPSDTEFKCFLKCMLLTIAVIREEKVRKDLILKKLDNMVAEDIVDIMKDLTNTCMEKIPDGLNDACEESWIFTKCWWETDNKLYLIPKAETK